MTAIRQKGSIPASDCVPAPVRSRVRLRIGLFFKYVALVFAVVLIALLTNGAFEVWFSYQEYKSSLIRIQREQAEAAAAKIGQFIHEIEAQVGWTTQLPWSASTLEQRRFDASRLLRQVPAITELSQIDATGHQRSTLRPCSTRSSARQHSSPARRRARSTSMTRAARSFGCAPRTA